MESTVPTSEQKVGVPFLLAVVLLAVSLFFRLFTYPVITSDYTYFVAKWFDTLHTHAGLTSFLYPFSDYAPLYLYFIKLLTFLPVYSLWSAKTLSFGFDICLAYIIARMLSNTTMRSKEKIFLAFSIALSIPTVVVNSTLWGQSDAAYAACTVGSMYFITRNNPRLAVFAFGLAISFKLQAIFFLPVLLGILFSKKAIKEIVWAPVVYILTIIPALIGGASLASTLFIYAHQSGEYTSLNVSSASVFAFVEKFGLTSSGEHTFFWLGLGLAALVGALSGFAAMRMPKRPDALVAVSLWCTLAVPYFLPRMHERYFFLADIFSVVLALYRPKSFMIPVLVVGASLLSYIPYLSGQVSYLSALHVDLRIPSALFFSAIVTVGVYVFQYIQPSKVRE